LEATQEVERDCGCCDDEDIIEETNNHRPVIGKPLTVSIDWGLNIKNIITADTLLKILKDKSYDGYGEFEGN
jgi:hypothetical protein